MLDPIIADPPTSMEGALTGHVNTAVLDKPSLSTPPESARRSVWPVAGRSSEHVNSDRCNVDEDVSEACFPASASVNPVTLDISICPDVDA